MTKQQWEGILRRVKKKKKELKKVGQLPQAPVIAVNPFEYAKIKSILCKVNGIYKVEEINAIKYIGIGEMQFVCMLGVPNHDFQIVSQINFVKRTACHMEKAEKIKKSKYEKHKL